MRISTRLLRHLGYVDAGCRHLYGLQSPGKGARAAFTGGKKESLKTTFGAALGRSSQARWVGKGKKRRVVGGFTKAETAAAESLGKAYTRSRRLGERKRQKAAAAKEAAAAKAKKTKVTTKRSTKK